MSSSAISHGIVRQVVNINDLDPVNRRKLLASMRPGHTGTDNKYMFKVCNDFKTNILGIPVNKGAMYGKNRNNDYLIFEDYWQLEDPDYRDRMTVKIMKSTMRNFHTINISTDGYLGKRIINYISCNDLWDMQVETTIWERDVKGMAPKYRDIVTDYTYEPVGSVNWRHTEGGSVPNWERYDGATNYNEVLYPRPHVSHNNKPEPVSLGGGKVASHNRCDNCVSKGTDVCKVCKEFGGYIYHVEYDNSYKPLVVKFDNKSHHVIKYHTPLKSVWCHAWNHAYNPIYNNYSVKQLSR